MLMADISVLASQAADLLAQAYPYLASFGGDVISGAGKKLGSEMVEKAKQLLGKIEERKADTKELATAAKDAHNEPEDEDTLAALRRQLKKIMRDDAELVTAMAKILTGMQPITSIDIGEVTGSLNIKVINNFVDSLAPAAPSPEELRAATGRYLQHLVDRYQFLELKGMGVSDRVSLQLPLLEMYVPLKARVEMPEGDTWARDLRLAGKRLIEEEAEAIGQRLSEPQPVLEMLQENDGLIVLGDPGSGKTTFLKYVALSLATGVGGDSLGLEPRLPVLAPLSAYAAAIKEEDVPLTDFIAGYYQHRGVELPLEGIIGAALERGKAVVLLDGLDEVRDPRQRNLVVSRVTDFYTFHRSAGNKLILSSRVVGYREVRPAAEGLAECTLVDFGDEEIEAFVERWTTALEKAASGGTAISADQAAVEKEELLQAIGRSAAVKRLAANPLLLTILALMKRQGIVLPDRRVELYQSYVETLLKHWNLARSLDGRSGRDLDVVETTRILAPLALWMQETAPGRGLVSEHDLCRKLEEIFAARDVADAEGTARRFLDDLRSHAGLLLDRGGRRYGFIHLSFLEYLAGVAVAMQGQQSIGPIVDTIAEHAGEDAWYEVILLAVAYIGIIQMQDQAAGAVLQELIRRAPGEPGQAVVLAGNAAADAGAGGISPRCRQAVTESLLVTMRDSCVKAAVRVKAGNALARLGDPRPEVMTVDQMQLCLVPAGPFWMGAGDDDKDAFSDERPCHELSIPYDYWIGRFPVTVAQLRLYAEDGGHLSDLRCLKDPECWPVSRLSWHEAGDFCRWLGKRWLASSSIEEGWQVRLPSEAEWEKAARGGYEVPQEPVLRCSADRLEESNITKIENPMAKRRYPWGDESDSDRASIWETRIGSASVVGCFPAGVSPYGCEELSGNLWEWTRSLWGKEGGEPDFGYPYQPQDGREDESSDHLRVLRGGAFYLDRRNARCSFRYRLAPDFRLNLVGFRVVVLPFSSDL
jgi:formylglycine-generating enzyme required for sulfatase activity